MADYHFMADVLTTFRSCPDGIKALIVGGFYAAATACVLGSQYLCLLRLHETGRVGRAGTESTSTASEVIDLTDERMSRGEARDG